MVSGLIRTSSCSIGVRSMIGSIVGGCIFLLVGLQFLPLHSYWIAIGVVFICLAAMLAWNFVTDVRNVVRSSRYRKVALNAVSGAPTIDGGRSDFQPTLVHRVIHPWPFVVAVDASRGLIRLVDRWPARIIPTGILIAVEIQNRQDVTIEGKVSGRPYIGATYGGATGGWVFGAKTKSKVRYKDNVILHLVWEGADHAPVRLQIPFESKSTLANDWLLTIRSAQTRLPMSSSGGFAPHPVAPLSPMGSNEERILPSAG